jgi:hypothetical protein
MAGAGYVFEHVAATVPSELFRRQFRFDEVNRLNAADRVVIWMVDRVGIRRGFKHISDCGTGPALTPCGGLPYAMLATKAAGYAMVTSRHDHLRTASIISARSRDVRSDA